MTTYFVDTSSLVKRYVNESGSAWVRSWIELSAGNVIIVSERTAVEVFSALSRRRRDGTLTANAVLSLQNDFLFHMENEYIVVVLDSTILAKARQLVEQYPLRTLDSIQLTCAIHAAAVLSTPMTFICADSVLLATAAIEGFSNDNPNLHL